MGENDGKVLSWLSSQFKTTRVLISTISGGSFFNLHDLTSRSVRLGSLFVKSSIAETISLSLPLSLTTISSDPPFASACSIKFESCEPMT